MLFKTNINQKQLFLFQLFLFFSILANVVVCSSSVFAEAKQSTLAMSVSSSDLLISLSPKTSGAFGKSSSSIISVNTDNFTGYTLSIVASGSGSGSTQPNSLVNDKGDEIRSIDSSVSESSFSSSSNYNNKWGYRPSQFVTMDGNNQVVTTNNTDYLPVPGTDGAILDITNTSNSEDNTYTIEFGAKVDYDLPSGDYSNTLTIIAVANDIVYNINYDKNSDDATIANMPTVSPQPVVIAGETPTSTSITTLSSATPTRSGYNFAGWCDVATTTDPITGSQSCSGTIYGANDEYGIDQTVDGTNIRLYAIWTVAEYDVVFKTSTGISKIEIKKDNTTKCIIDNNSTSSTTGSVCRLSYATPYEIIATVADGYTFSTWNNSTSNGIISNVNSASTMLTMGTGTTIITPIAAPRTYSLTINFAGKGITSVEVRTASGTGGTLKGTVSISGGSVSNLNYNTSYYLYPNFDYPFEFKSWAKTSSVGTLSSTSVSNPTFMIGGGDGVVTLSTKIDPQETLQGWTGCSELDTYDTVVLYDNRDGEPYTVGKIVDSVTTVDDGDFYYDEYEHRCWILDNLRLDPTAVDLNTLKGNTNASDTTLTYFKNGGGTTSNKYPTSGVSNWISGYSYSVPLVFTEKRHDLADEDQVPIYGGASYEIGTYYNFCAASAGSYCYGNGISYGTSSGNATEDICPSGWQLPPSSKYSFIKDNTYFSIGEDMSIPLSGFLNQGWTADIGDYGYFWSSTRSDNERMYNLTVDNGSASITTSERDLGFSVRCMKK
ncbi:hypothetical protein IJH23_00495 [Candidatus Saccharibacteria bacterium]|nr:hypothetical protein [Candidatus Saccharibacteria bacterium]